MSQKLFREYKMFEILTQILDSGNSYKSFWIVISLRTRRRLPIAIGSCEKMHGYKKVFTQADGNLIIDVTGKYGKPDNVNYQTSGTVVADETGAPVVDLRCKKCRCGMFLIFLISDVYLHHRHQFYYTNLQKRCLRIITRTHK